MYELRQLLGCFMSENALDKLLRGSLAKEVVNAALSSIDPRTVGTDEWPVFVARVHKAASIAAPERAQFHADLTKAIDIALVCSAECWY